VNINQATINLVKEFEGCKLEAYQDIVGVWTIGYGTTEGAGLGVVPKAGMKITQEEAERELFLTPTFVVADMHVAEPAKEKSESLITVIIRAIAALFGVK
jgi:GH24 family phage-related lysozyme (muramidase)